MKYVRIKKVWQKVSPDWKVKAGMKMSPRSPGGAAERRRDDPAPLPGHRRYPGQLLAPGNTTQRDQQMLRWIHRPVMTLQPECVSSHRLYCCLCELCYVPGWQVCSELPGCRTIAAMCCRSQLFIGYWCMEAWRGPRVCDWPSGKQMLTCRYCHWARQSTMSLFKESSQKISPTGPWTLPGSDQTCERSLTMFGMESTIFREAGQYQRFLNKESKIWPLNLW